MEEYLELSQERRDSYDLIAPVGAPAPPVIEDQVLNNPNMKWVQGLSAGVDYYMASKVFRESSVPLTNVKGAFSSVLAEFVALGVLQHTKHLERFIERKKARKWEMEPMELVSNKHMVIVGYGDIGSACARVAKNGFGMKVTGVKRRPEEVSDKHRSYCDEVVGNDQYDRVIAEADFVVAVLPKVAGVTDNFFSTESTFSKMKSSAVFMNIGRGTTVEENDLAKALKTGQISGAVLDVFQVEPLPEESELWDCPNLLLTPHCADCDTQFMHRAFQILADNLKIFTTEGTSKLLNICDKEAGY